MASKGLGKNINILLSNTSQIKQAVEKEHGLQKLAVEYLQPGKYQPRREMDEGALNQLADSIKKQGILQPIAVRPVDNNRYEIIAGERRWRAAQIAELSSVPVIIHDVNDETAMALALIENVQREDLNIMDEARALHRLAAEFDLTHQKIAELVSKSRASVSNILRLMQLSDEVKLMLENGDLEMGHARALLSLDDGLQTQTAKLIVSRELSVRETERLINNIKQQKPVKIPQNQLPEQLESQIQQLSQRLNTKLSLKAGPKGRGKLIIHYQDADRLEALLALLET